MPSPSMRRGVGNGRQADADARLQLEIAARLRAEKALQESQALLRELAARQESIKEEERKRISREIHDGLGQDLYALRIDVCRLHRRTGAAHPRLHAQIGAALEHIDSLMKSVRALISNLRPEPLDLSLHAAIQSQTREFERRTGITCRFLPEVDTIPLGEDGAVALFRILQESLTNVSRHAQATRVEVGLREQDGMLVLRVADDGRGLRPDARRRKDAFGLIGMRERVAALGGRLAIASESGMGVVLTVCIPVDAGAPRLKD